MDKISAFLCILFSPKTYFKIPIPVDAFTQKTKSLRYLKSDPLRLREVTARFIQINFQMDLRLKKSEGIYPQRVHLFTAGEDRIVKNEKTSHYLAESFFDIHQYSYPEAFHTLEFEEPEKYFKDLREAILTNHSAD